MKRRSTFVASLVALATASGIASAQTTTEPRSTTRGLHIGAALNGSSLELTDAEAADVGPESGSGFSLTAGYGFTPQIGLLLTVTGASMKSGEYALGHADVAGRFSFANPDRAFVPYLELGFAGLGLVLDDADQTSFSGSGFTGAAGLNFFLNPNLALDVNFRFTTGEFTSFTSGGETVTSDDGAGANTGRFNVGVSWFPGGGR